MDWLTSVDWGALFIPTHSILEMIVRGTLMYLGLFLIFRFITKRQTGSVGLADILVVVVIADAAQNAFANEYRSISEGLVLVLTIIFWDLLIDWIAFRVPWVGRLLQEPPLPLVRDGVILRRNLRRELISIDELEAQLRKQGVDDVSKVKLAAIESDGEVSVVTMNGGKTAKPRRPRRRPA